MSATIEQPKQAIRLHRFYLSGHSHRVELFLSLLKLPYALIDVALANKAHKQPDFLAMNPFGQVPVIQDGDVTLADSNAILVYLASRYGAGTWLPRDAAEQAKVQRWLSVAAGDLAHGPAKARLATVFKAPVNMDEAIARANGLFTIMDNVLQKMSYLAGAAPTVADIANYTYTAHAPEGNVSLEPYANIRRWLKRIEDLPGFVPMEKTAVGIVA